MSAHRARAPHAALVYNPVKVDAKRLRSSLRTLSRTYGWGSPKFYETTVDDPGRLAAGIALQEDAATVLVAGGDGTVRAVAEAMAGTRVPLAIVPGGTGNLFARNLRLPLNPPDAMLRAVFTGFTHAVDVGWARLTREDGSSSEHAFVVMAGIGLDADMIANTRTALKKQVGWVAYIHGAARSLPGAKAFRTVFQVDDGRLHSAKVYSMLFANCGALPAGIALVPDASIADGTLDVAIIQPTGPFGWLAVWRHVWWHNSVLRRTRAGRRMLGADRPHTAIRYLNGRTVEAAVPEPTPIELDGDAFGAAIRIECRIDHGGLELILPAGHDVSRF